MVGDEDGGPSRTGSLKSGFRRDEVLVDTRASLGDPTTVDVVDAGVSKRRFFVSAIGVDWSFWSQWAFVVPLKHAFDVGDP